MEIERNSKNVRCLLELQVVGLETLYANEQSSKLKKIYWSKEEQGMQAPPCLRSKKLLGLYKPIGKQKVMLILRGLLKSEALFWSTFAKRLNLLDVYAIKLVINEGW